MDVSKLKESEYKTTKISISFLKANTVSLVFPLPLVIIYIAIAFLAEKLLSPRPEMFGNAARYFSMNGELPYLLLSMAIYIVIMIILIVLHELTHAFFFMRGCENGWKSIKFGVKSLTPYCHCREATTVSIARMSCLAPLFTVSLPLSILAIATGFPLLHLLAVVMIFSSGGDLWIIWKLRPFNGKTDLALDMEEEIGMIVYEPIPNVSLSDISSEEKA
ncbi:MAG: DUF3267 domain-containing protein [Clostridiaceae bacterium]|nr:DUF3267 domain-containing protein [Clostridiaceae bacterium]